MRRLAQHIIALPVIAFLIVSLSAPALAIHHVHHIEKSEPADHDEATTEPKVDVPTTYHETHIVTLLSGDSFNASTRNDVVPSLHEFIATMAVVPVLSSAFPLSRITFAHFRTPSQSSRDKCVLFCSFLI